MAFYFPPLDRCLAGNERIISWKTAYRALCDHQTAEENTTLERFLNDEETFSILSRPLKPWGRAYADSKSKFDSKTAPIQVSQSNTGDYDLDEIKKDALWLAEQLKIDEVVALRAAIIEWQQRPSDALITSAGAGETSAGVTADLGASLLASTSGQAGSATGILNGRSVDFKKDDVRHERLLRTYVDERSYLLKMSADLVSNLATKDLARARDSRSWIDQLSFNVASIQRKPNDSASSQNYITECVDWIGLTLDKLYDQTRWAEAWKSDTTREEVFIASTLLNISDAMRLGLAHLYGLDGALGPTPVTKWFELMNKHQYLLEVPISQQLQESFAIQQLVSSVSLAMLQLPKTVRIVQDTARAAARPAAITYPELREKAYVREDECVKKLNLLIFEAAAVGYANASPAIYAWAIIITHIRNEAFRLNLGRQEREDGEAGSSDTEFGDRRGSLQRGSGGHESQLEKQWESLRDFDLGEARDDPASALLRVAVVQMDVYAALPDVSVGLTAAYGAHPVDKTALLARDNVLSLIREGFDWVGYEGEVLEALFATLSPPTPAPDQPTSLLANNFLADNESSYVLDQALQRYPYELSPLLRILTTSCRADTKNDTGLPAGNPNAVMLLESMQTYTIMVPPDFRSFALENEEANTNEMVLTDTLLLFTPKQTSYDGRPRLIGDRSMMDASGEGEGNVLFIPAGTSGHVIREDRPMVLKLQHKHSGLEYLGLLLSTLLPDSELRPAPPAPGIDRQGAAEIIALVNALLGAASRQHQDVEEAKFTLGRLSFALSNEQDIISIVADIFEMELLAHLDQAAQIGSLELVTACAEFFCELVTVSPERAWSILGRNSLLGINGGASALVAVVGGTEVQLSQYRFLKICTELYSRLVDSAISGLVKRKARAPRTTNRFDSPMDYADSTPERTMRAVLTAYQRIMLDAFQNLPSWRFAMLSEKQQIARLMLESFETLLRCTHGLKIPQKPLEDDGKPRETMSGLLHQASDMLVQAFTPEVGTSLTIESLGGLLGDAMALGDDLLPVSLRTSLMEQVKSLCGFLIRLLRTIKTTNAKGAIVFATAMLKSTPVLAMLLATEHALKQSLCDLLAEIVQALASSDVDPPSLLGQLGSEAAKSFLDVVSQLDRPLCDVNIECSMWSFLSAVLEGRQQWFSMYLLTGTLPKTRLKDSSSRGNGKSLLTYALDQLSSVAILNPQRAKAMLRFVAVAQSMWVWATNILRSYPDVLKNILTWLDELKAETKSGKALDPLISAQEHQMAAYVCDILSVNLHASLETGDKALLKMLVPKLSFLKEDAVRVKAYNRSLQRNLADNLSMKYPDCDLEDFRRTPSNAADYGKDFCYDRELAGKILGHEELAWFGSDDRKPAKHQSFDAEVARANINLSLVDAQVNLLKSWAKLATTLSECLALDPALPPPLIRAADTCLKANAEAKTDEPVTAEVIQIRAELAFVLMSKLVTVKVSDAAMKDLLSPAWDLVRTSPVDYDVATALDDLLYYRTLLQILYLALRPHIYMDIALNARPVQESRPTDATDKKHPSLPVSIGASLVEIVRKTVGPGFRALCGNLHEDLLLAQPSDFALLTGILQAVLSVKGCTTVYPQIAEAVASSNAVRGALSLYSWADQLAEVMDQDPIYGEVAVTFLLTLSSVPQVAEQMALGGVLIQLSTANLSNYFRKPGGKGPFDEPVRMFHIWSEGFLPLCLNLLEAVGPPIAGEISAFLNSFPEQLARAQDAFRIEGPAASRKVHAGNVTLGLVREARNLVTITLLLQLDIARAAAEGINASSVPPLAFDEQKAKEELEKLSRTKRSLADKIVATNARETAWAHMQASGTNENMLQAKVVQEIREALRLFGEGES